MHFEFKLNIKLEISAVINENAMRAAPLLFHAMMKLRKLTQLFRML
jgi:hypothetical protein